MLAVLSPSFYTTDNLPGSHQVLCFSSSLLVSPQVGRCTLKLLEWYNCLPAGLPPGTLHYCQPAGLPPGWKVYTLLLWVVYNYLLGSPQVIKSNLLGSPQVTCSYLNCFTQEEQPPKCQSFLYFYFLPDSSFCISFSLRIVFSL